MKRYIFNTLKNWKNTPGRKSLLMRGARQVGKTYAVRELAKNFECFLEVNFEKHRQAKLFFNDSLDPLIISKKLSAFYSIPVIPGKTLLFFDEIQACPNAISSLRFFYEDMPDLHIVAAGSLIEFALKEIPSMGVGRISSLFMYPMNFCEFLEAFGQRSLVDFILHADFQTPLDDPFHRKLIDYMKEYLLIGGLPEVVQAYLDSNDLRKSQAHLDDIIVTIKDDFAKYKEKAPLARLTEVFESIVFQSGAKFKFSAVESGTSSKILGDALNLLVDAGIAYKIYHSDARGLPLGAQINSRKFKVILFDVGVHQRLLGLDLSSFLLTQNFQVINSGCMAEAFVGLELLSNSNPSNKKSLYYWHREAKSSNAEVDYVIQKNDKVLPIEVKAGTKGQMQSLRIFMAERRLTKGIRTSLENFGSLGDIDILPLYAIKKIQK